MDQLTNALKCITIDDDTLRSIASVKIQRTWSKYWIRHTQSLIAIIKIQKNWRKYRVSSNQLSLFELPPVLIEIQTHLKEHSITIASANDDGRVNSILDEQTVIDRLLERYSNRIRVAPVRMWYDIIILDYYHGWIPVNIKSSSMKYHDNTGNLAMCAYAYTNANIKLDVPYKNGELSQIITARLKSKQYNRSHRDYYFLVINKNDPSDVIINSIRGLSSLSNNTNNLPFQIKWSNNRNFQRKTVDEAIDQFMTCIQKNKPSWQQQFICAMKNL